MRSHRHDLPLRRDAEAEAPPGVEHTRLQLLLLLEREVRGAAVEDVCRPRLLIRRVLPHGTHDDRVHIDVDTAPEGVPHLGIQRQCGIRVGEGLVREELAETV